MAVEWKESNEELRYRAQRLSDRDSMDLHGRFPRSPATYLYMAWRDQVQADYRRAVERADATQKPIYEAAIRMCERMNGEGTAWAIVAGAAPMMLYPKDRSLLKRDIESLEASFSSACPLWWHYVQFAVAAAP